MRAVSAQWKSTLSKSHEIVTVVESWRDGVKLATIPIITGTVQFDGFSYLRRRCVITVPLHDGTTDYNPRSDPYHPLASSGQRMQIFSGVRHPDGTVETVTQGWYLISDWAVDEAAGTITVTGSDLGILLSRAKIMNNGVSMRIPAPNDLLARQIEIARAMVYPRLMAEPFPGWSEDQILTLGYGGTLPNHPIFWSAGGVQFQEGDDRMAALSRFVEQLPADMYASDGGSWWMRPLPDIPDESTPSVATITDASGTDPTLSQRNYVSNSEKIFSCVTVYRQTLTGKQTGRVSWRYTAGPWSVDGPFGYNTKFITTTVNTWASADEDLDAIAQATLRRSSIYGLSESVECVPDPSLQIWDVVTVNTATSGSFKGLVSGINLPLTAVGPMTLTVSTATHETNLLMSKVKEES